jgi:hypothetical protein
LGKVNSSRFALEHPSKEETKGKATNPAEAADESLRNSRLFIGMKST